MPWAMMSLSVDVKGMSEDPLEGVVDGELESIVLVKSSVCVPESRCCAIVASTAEELGADVENAQMICCCVSEFAGIVKASLGCVPLVELRDSDKVATLGGLSSTVGIT